MRDLSFRYVVHLFRPEDKEEGKTPISDIAPSGLFILHLSLPL
jgi:hypothetical protein